MLVAFSSFPLSFGVPLVPFLFPPASFFPLASSLLCRYIASQPFASPEPAFPSQETLAAPFFASLAPSDGFFSRYVVSFRQPGLSRSPRRPPQSPVTRQSDVDTLSLMAEDSSDWLLGPRGRSPAPSSSASFGSASAGPHTSARMDTRLALDEASKIIAASRWRSARLLPR